MTVAVLAVRQLRSASAAPSFQDAASTHLGAVHRYLTHLVRNADLAEDLTSETFERAFRHWHQYDPSRGAVLTWLVTIARRIALDHFRSEARRTNREERYAAMEAVATDPVDGVGETLPVEMRAALASLSDVEREVVALRVLLDVEGPAAAKILGISTSACSTTLHRAMTKLRKDLAR